MCVAMSRGDYFQIPYAGYFSFLYFYDECVFGPICLNPRDRYMFTKLLHLHSAFMLASFTSWCFYFFFMFWHSFYF